MDIVASQAKQTQTEIIMSDMTEKFKIPKNELVTVISGHDFRPELFGFKRKVPTLKDYQFYYFEHPKRQASHHRLLLCKYNLNESGTL
jgi:hypothetical protein